MRAFVILMCFVSISGCSKKTPGEEPPVPVTVQAARAAQGQSEVRYSAVLQADKQLALAFKSPGFVTSILQMRGPDGALRNVQAGDPVKEGTVLAVVRRSEYKDRVDQARAGFLQAKSDYERASSLFEQNVVSKADYDAALARFREAQANLDVQQTALSDTELRAPMDGTVIRRNIESGQLVSSQTEVFTFASTRKVKVVFGVPDVEVLGFKPGQSLAVNLSALPQRPFKGEVTRVGAAADPTTRMFDVEVTVDNPNGELKEGMIAALESPRRRSQMAGIAAQASAVEIPLNSVVRPKGEPQAFAVYVAQKTGNGYRAEERRVRLGRVLGKWVVALEGVSPNEIVVDAGSTLLSNHQPIVIIPVAD